MAHTFHRCVAAAMIAVACIAVGAAALHEDEAGDHDWVRPGLGHAHLAAFPPSIGKSSKPVHVATRRNVVASFSTVRGTMRWRHVLGANDNVTCLAATEQIVVVGTESGLLLALDAATGKLFRSLPVAIPATAPDARVAGCAFVAAAGSADAAIKALVVAPSGAWTVSLTTQAGYLPAALEGADTKLVQALAGLDGAAVRTATYTNVKGGARVLVAVLKDGTATLVKDGAASKAVPATDSKHRDVLKRGTFASGTPELTLHSCGGGAVLTLNDDGSAIASAKALATDAVKLTATAQAAVTPEGFLELAKEPTGLRERAGTAPKLLAARASDDGERVEALVASSSGAFQYLKLKAGAPAGSWIVEGGLGDAHSVLFPKRRGDLVAADARPTREHKFGLRDRIVLVSRHGALFALRTGDGGNSTEWAAFPAGDATIHYAAARNRCFSVRSLTDGDDLVVVRLEFRATDAHPAALAVQLSYDVFTGALVSHASAPAADAAVFLGDGAAVSAAGAVSGEATDKPREYHVVDRKAGVITGFTVAAGATEATESWRVDLGAPLAAFASGAADPRAVSSVEHLRYIPNATSGAKDIRRKYPTANVLVAAHYADGDDDGVKVLTVTALDAVTGQTLASMRHHDVDGDVSVAVVEHVVIYHFLSVETMRFMVGAWELFEHQDAHLVDNQYASPAMVVMSFLDKRRRFSALAARPPQVSAQLLAFPHGAVSAIGATVSMQGIARKQIIFALAEGTVVAVPLSMFLAGGIPEAPAAGAPRPPPKATILVPSTQFLTHRNRALGAALVATAPTPLESTAHVVVAGLDLFYTRASSGKPFDMIDEEFNRAALAVGCVVLPVATLVVRYIAQQRSLSVMWS